MALRTPISYYGGKQKMLVEILPLIPPHRVYSEVFFGGGAVFWAKEPAQHETINDRDDVVINFYVTLKRHYKALKKRIDQTLVSRTQHDRANALIKMHRHGKEIHTIDLAWAFWMAANFSFVCKINGSGLRHGDGQWSSVPRQLINKKAEFTELLLNRISNATIENRHAVAVLKTRNSKEAFHYIDPPYPDTDHGHYIGQFTWDSYRELLEFLEVIKGRFLLSAYPNDILNDYIQRNGWIKREFEKPALSQVKTRSRKVELLVSNYASTHGTMSMFPNTYLAHVT